MKKPTILIVDDEENIVRSLQRTLRDQFNVLTATSGETALDIIAREDIAVILTDQRMPGLTGVQLLERVKQQRPKTVGILISGYSDVSALVDALNLGIVRGYIPKPWDTEELRSKLKAAVQEFDAIINDRELLHSSAEAVTYAQTQLAELKKVLDLVVTGEIEPLFAAAKNQIGTPGSWNHPQFNRAYLDQLSDGFALINAEGIVDYCNPAIHVLLGVPECVPGVNLLAIPALADCEPLVHAVQAALAGHPTHTEFFWRIAQGADAFLEIAATPITEHGQYAKAILVIRDQTARQKTIAHLKGLNVVAEAIVQTLEFEQRLHLMLNACREATQADGAFVYIFTPGATNLLLAGAVGLDAATIAFLKQHPIPFGAGLVGHVAATGLAQAQTQLCDAALIYPQLVQDEKIKSVALAPLHDSTGVSGVVGVFTRTLRQVSKSDMRLLSSIGNQVGLALHNARLYEQIQQQARTDALTGLFNRRYWMELAEREFTRAQRLHTSLIALMIDLDQFKRINDAFGHAIGDQTLHATATVLAANVRTIDLVGRYGGDEFVILLPNCEPAQAQQIVQRLIAQVTALQIPTSQPVFQG